MDIMLPFKLWGALQKEPDDLSRYRQSGVGRRDETRIMDPGIFWTYLIGQSIQNERDSGNFDLLAVSPLGSLPTTWVFGLGAMHYKRLNIRWFKRTVLPISWLAVVALGIWLLPPLIIITIIAFIFPLWREFDILLGSLIGMVAPTYNDITSDYVTVGVLFHLASQGAILAVGIVVNLLLSIWFDLWVGFSFALALAVTYLLCHSIVMGLWRLLLYRTNATPEDIRFVLGE